MSISKITLLQLSTVAETIILYISENWSIFAKLYRIDHKGHHCSYQDVWSSHGHKRALGWQTSLHRSRHDVWRMESWLTQHQSCNNHWQISLLVAILCSSCYSSCDDEEAKSCQAVLIQLHKWPETFVTHFHVTHTSYCLAQYPSRVSESNCFSWSWLTIMMYKLALVELPDRDAVYLTANCWARVLLPTRANLLISEQKLITYVRYLWKRYCIRSTLCFHYYLQINIYHLWTAVHCTTSHY